MCDSTHHFRRVHHLPVRANIIQKSHICLERQLWDFCWQREKDSNPHIRSQSPLCYLYTIPLSLFFSLASCGEQMLL